MTHQISETSIYIAGAARFHDLIYLVTKDRGLVESDIEHSRFIAFDQGQLAHMGDRNWSAAAVCVAKKPAEKMVAVGEDGDVFTYVGGTVRDEMIEPRPITLRGIGVVDGFPIACGMNRQAFKRGNENSWTSMHAPAPASDENAGFEAIDGYAEDEVYAVGWNGEIWEWNGEKWTQHPSPTNLILTGICCAGDNKVYICGQHGTLIRGRHDEWQVIELEDIIDDFWDISSFNDTLYLTTMTMLFTFINGELAPVDFGADSPATCYRLTHAESVLWSVGSDDVFCFDGSAWTRVD